MAVTKIWRIKGRIDNVINYASNIDKTTFTAGSHILSEV